MNGDFKETFTFDDVLLVPQKSDILPKDTILRTKLTNSIWLNLPFLSAPMDTVTEHKMAIKLALYGGLGIIHKNLSIEEQINEVDMVKRFENGFIEDPITVKPNDLIIKVVKIRNEKGYKKVPVVDEGNKLVGLITDVDYFSPFDNNQAVSSRMIGIKDLFTAQAGVSLESANQIIRDHRLKILCVVDDTGKLVNIVMRRDMEKNQMYPKACKDEKKQLRVGAAVAVGYAGIERAEALIEAGADVIVIDTAHGHSAGVIKTLIELKKAHPEQQIIVGNIASANAAEELVKAGADAIKVGIGPGSICTTRIVAGIGVPQLSAIINVAKRIKSLNKIVPIIADGGIKSSGDIVKALAAGANVVMMGNLFAGTDQSPGKVEYLEGRMYKVYRGMGSLEAMELGSKDRYGQADVSRRNKLVPEGVAGKLPYKGPVDRIIYQLTGGLRSGMGYCGAKTIPELQANAEFIKISSSGLKESHPHDLSKIKSAPNYHTDYTD